MFLATLLFLFGLFISVSIAALGYAISHRFVESRLRYVDAVQRPIAPVIAGGVAALIALPVVALLPFVTVWTAVLLGVGVYAGVSTGARSIRRQIGA